MDERESAEKMEAQDFKLDLNPKERRLIEVCLGFFTVFIAVVFFATLPNLFPNSSINIITGEIAFFSVLIIWACRRRP